MLPALSPVCLRLNPAGQTHRPSRMLPPSQAMFCAVLWLWAIPATGRKTERKIQIAAAAEKRVIAEPRCHRNTAQNTRKHRYLATIVLARHDRKSLIALTDHGLSGEFAEFASRPVSG
jgi:hypothetical protein